jgi:hypothetical protein
VKSVGSSLSAHKNRRRKPTAGRRTVCALHGGWRVSIAENQLLEQFWGEAMLLDRKRAVGFLGDRCPRIAKIAGQLVASNKVGRRSRGVRAYAGNLAVQPNAPGNFYEERVEAG